MVWAFLSFVVLAAVLVKLGAMGVWVTVLAAALKSLGLLALVGLVGGVFLALRRRPWKR